MKTMTFKQPFCTRAARPVVFGYRDKLETKLLSIVEGGGGGGGGGGW